MRIRIVGAGSLGLLFAGRLSAQQPAIAEVQLICRTAQQAELINREGVRITGLDGSVVHGTPEAAAEDELERLSWNLPDVIILAVKQNTITPAFAERLKRQIGPGTFVLSLQNGAGHERILAGALPYERIWLAVTTEASRILASNEADHTGRGKTMIGLAGSDAYGEKELRTLLATFASASISAERSANIAGSIWHKLVVNSVINPLTALLNVKNGELLALPDAVFLMKRLLAEALELAAHSGLTEFHPDWEQLVGVCTLTAANTSSMLQDVLAGRATEIDSITGYMLEQSRKADLAMPTHEALYRLVKAMRGGTA